MTDLRDRFRLADHLPTPDLWSEAVSRARMSGSERQAGPSGPGLGRRLVTASFALLVFAAAAIFAWQAFSVRPGPTDVDQPRPSVDLSATPSPSILPADSFEVGAQPVSVVAADGWVWVGFYDFVDGLVGIDRLDPQTGELVSTVPLEGRPQWLAAGDGVLWVAQHADVLGRELVRVETSADRIDLRLPGLTGPIVETDRGLWAVEPEVESGSNSLVLLDEATGEILHRVGVPGTPIDAVESGGFLWVMLLDSEGDTPALVRIDEDELAGSWEAVDGAEGIWLAGGDDGIWVSALLPGQRGHSAFVSAEDHAVQPFGDVYNFRPFAVGDGRVWIVAGPSDGAIRGVCGMRIESGEVDVCSDVDVADLTSMREPVAFDVTTNTVWVAAWDSARVYRIQVPS